ncbi:MAG: hypothetical protein QP830_01165 [Actinotignum sanguinis]|uniref:hypothetical protein n=1 Tax=Actinotignum sanguinis TaxID=1445614 RepID=UPI00254DAF31|nr:hypothetical protein [Actinotignum sanguinis]MDK8286064.1 hypothetical protein [Actinotignum sanguinis]MDK8650415.1 hypothetical protein [Actinotignum sanguinis]MDK8800917.1 hypothetical protein [Actinotignum sanguinis]
MSVCVLVPAGAGPALARALPYRVAELIAGQPAPRADLTAGETVTAVVTDPGAVTKTALAQLLATPGRNTAWGAPRSEEPNASESRGVLAVPAPVYTFDSRALHLCGGLDTAFTLPALAVDAQWRLSAAGVPGEQRATPLLEAGIPALDTVDYLRILTKNLSPAYQLEFLAPLFLALIDHPIRSSGVDTAALDLARRPGNDDVPTLQIPSTTFGGAQVVRDWAASLAGLESRNEAALGAARIPDRRLPHVADFLDLVWASAGIPASEREFLDMAFADVRRDHEPSIAFAVAGSDTAARARFARIAAEIPEPLYLWDPESRELSERSVDPTAPFQPARRDIGSAVATIAVTYILNLPARAVPWSGNHGVIIADVTTANLTAMVRTDWVGVTGTESLGANASVLNETLSIADRLITADTAQRDFVLGALSGNYRLDQNTYDDDHSLTSLVAQENGGIAAALAALRSPIHAYERVGTTQLYEEPGKSGARKHPHLRRVLRGLATTLKGERK